ncbi:MAG: glycosyltransferase family 2 protein, partial [Deltaproteobacteria bacterium]|nr:glycosyltransferase family 2 protein [Deltaproteobacteria bacterium]
MKKITAVIPFNQQPYFERMLQPILESPLIEKVLILRREPLTPSWPKCDTIEADSLSSSGTWNILLHNIRTEYLLLINDLHEILIVPGSMERFLDVAESTAAGMVFSDYYEGKDGALTEHPVNDYQTGSIRDDFDFGPVVVFSMPALRGALEQYGAVIKTKHAGLYDVRLKVSINTPP